MSEKRNPRNISVAAAEGTFGRRISTGFPGASFGFDGGGKLNEVAVSAMSSLSR